MIRRRMTVKRVDPWSVLKLGLFLNLAGGAIILITGVIVWSVIRRLQMIERGCEQIQNIFGLQECAVGGATVFRGGFLMVALFVVVMTAVLVFTAFLYNLVADLTGGVEFSAIDHTPPMVAQGSPRSGGGVQVAPELQQTRSAPVVVGPSGKRVPDAAVPADAIDRRTREPSRLKKAAQVASTKLTEASKQASATLTEATRTEAVTRARRTEAETESLDSIWLQRPGASSGNGGSADTSGAGGDGGRGRQPQGDAGTSASGQPGPPERAPASSSAGRSSRGGTPSARSSSGQPSRSPGPPPQSPRSSQGGSGRRSNGS